MVYPVHSVFFSFILASMNFVRYITVAKTATAKRTEAAIIPPAFIRLPIKAHRAPAKNSSDSKKDQKYKF